MSGGILPTQPVVPTQALTPTSVLMLTVAPTDVPEEGVAISEENFGDARFCEFLKEQFDTDGNGCFSDEELGAVRRIDFGTKYIQSPITEIKGFSYFPYLEYLTLNSAQKIDVCGVQNLSEIRMDREMGH